MGCTVAKAAPPQAGPRAVVSSKEVPGGKGGRKALLRKHDTDALLEDDSESKRRDEDDGDSTGSEQEQDQLALKDVGLSVGEGAERRRLSIMRTPPGLLNQTNRRWRGGSENVNSNAAASAGDSALRDPGHDIGNGAYGENGAHDSMPLTFSCVTRPGNDPAKRQKENQDTYCVHTGLDKDEECFVVCVFDGHGPNGALASGYVRERLVETWADMGLGHPRCSSEEEIRRILHNGCVEVNHRLATSHIDVYVSGSTGILGVIKRDTLYVANVGDSRCVLGRVSGRSGALEAVDMSEDQKPDRPDEHARIIRYGGRVFEWGVPRVWQRDVDMPGLAMARSFGDLAAESVGVFAEPEVSVRKLTREDRFLIFATDGVWEFMSSAEVVNIIGKHMETKSPAQAARDASVEVINASVAKWNAVEDVVDDSTCVIIALDYEDAPAGATASS